MFFWLAFLSSMCFWYGVFVMKAPESFYMMGFSMFGILFFVKLYVGNAFTKEVPDLAPGYVRCHKCKTRVTAIAKFCRCCGGSLPLTDAMPLDGHVRHERSIAEKSGGRCNNGYHEICGRMGHHHCIMCGKSLKEGLR